MTQRTAPSAPRRRTAARSPQPETPQQQAAFTRRVRKAAREAEAAMAVRDAAEAAEAAAALPAPVAGPALPTGPDAHGHDPAEYQWLPVRRRHRSDGWTPQRQQDFIATLAETGCVLRAADAAGMTTQSCYRLRRSPGGENFAAAWDVALHHAARLLLDTAFERAFNGTDEPVFDKEGRRIGRRMRQNDRMTMFLLRAYMPERFRHAHRDWRAADEALPPPPPAIELMIERLAPEPPADPAGLMAPDELEDAIAVANILPPGQLPRHRVGLGSNYRDPDPLTAEQEAELEQLKRGGPPFEPSTLRHFQRRQQS